MSALGEAAARYAVPITISLGLLTLNRHGLCR